MEEDLLLKLSDDEEDIYTAIIKENLDERRIVLNEEVDDSALESICLFILKWNKEDKDIDVKDRKKIYIYVNSNGGDCVMGMQILSLIKCSETPIVTVGFAKCSSMASYILAAGHERYCFPDTVILYHDGQRGYYTSGNKGKDISKFFDKLEERLQKFMLDNTDMSEEFLEDIRDREYYMWADEAKEKNIVDKIIGIDCPLSEVL